MTIVPPNVDELEDAGFERAMIGAAMMGVGAGLRAVHDGVEATLVGLDMVRAAILDTAGRKN